MSRVKALARQLVPPAAYKGASRIRERLSEAATEGEGSPLDVAQRVSPEGVVLVGPFAGVWLGHTATWGTLAPYLAGTYEDELHSPLETAIALGPRNVVVIGAAEGYYAIGLAKRLPDAQVTAFEIDPVSRQRCRDNARRNGVLVDVLGECTPQELRSLVRSDTLIICDCEGAELALLDPLQIPALAKATIIVEVHDFVDPTISPTLADRFISSHDIEWVPAAPKTLRHYPALTHLGPSVAWRTLQEGRPCVMEWAVMTPL